MEVITSIHIKSIRPTARPHELVVLLIRSITANVAHIKPLALYVIREAILKIDIFTTTATAN